MKLRGSPSGIKSQLVFRDASKGRRSSLTHIRIAVSLKLSNEKWKRVLLNTGAGNNSAPRNHPFLTAIYVLQGREI